MRRVVLGGVTVLVLLTVAVILVTSIFHKVDDPQKPCTPLPTAVEVAPRPLPMEPEQVIAPSRQGEASGASSPVRWSVRSDKSGTQIAVAAGQPLEESLEDDYLDDIEIRTRLASLELTALLKEQSGALHEAGMIRDRMSRLRGKLPTDLPTNVPDGHDELLLHD